MTFKSYVQNKNSPIRTGSRSVILIVSELTYFELNMRAIPTWVDKVHDRDKLEQWQVILNIIGVYHVLFIILWVSLI